ncbi:unnamed protein product [Caenorhabditis bovis]|uniref:Fucosyltransferase n=1 Tax=Caenorhabditis bovis TaxID=2654633 RepID=A0A8S1EVB6_9PELO|nr:unnamed protein product [Caenorhabditis bovis]
MSNGGDRLEQAQNGVRPETFRGFCEIREDLNVKPDAILFHNADYSKNKRLRDLLSTRDPNVPFVLWSLESPSNDGYRPEANVINWTMTYRRDADIFAPYGEMVKLKQKAEIDFDEIWSWKTKSATWLGSNCHPRNGRMDLIRKMIEKGLQIDVWGACGKPPPICAGLDKQGQPCVAELIRPYKFYIALENSNCKHYVTEKFWKSLNDRFAVPIVLARKYYRELGVPDSAYIAIDDFRSLDEFVKFVKKVENDEELYMSYHKWRTDYKVIAGDGFLGFCELCKVLQYPEEVSKRRNSYSNLSNWHNMQLCDNSIAQKYLAK